MSQSAENSGRGVQILVWTISVLVPVLVALLFLFPQSGKLGDFDVSLLPGFHATLNSFTAVMLILALNAIKKGREKQHKNFILAGFGASAIFLVSYVIYHYQAEPTSYGGEGALKYIYYVLLITHIVLATLVLPLILMSLYFGLTDKREKHKKLVKFAFPVWLYVAISGVLVYFLISPYY